MRWRFPWSSGRFEADTLVRLAEVPFFADLPRPSLERLAATCWPREFAAGSPVLEEGDTGLGLFLILAGRVEVYKSNGAAAGEEVPIAVLGPGEVLGEMALLDERPRSASARALERTECLLLSREGYRRLIRRDPEIAWCMVPALLQRLRDLQARYVRADGRSETSPAEPERPDSAAGEPTAVAAVATPVAPNRGRGAEVLLRLPAAFAGCGVEGARGSVELAGRVFSTFKDQLRPFLDDRGGERPAEDPLQAWRRVLEEGGEIPERMAESFLRRLRPARREP